MRVVWRDDMLRQLSQSVPFGLSEVEGNTRGGVELCGVFGENSQSATDEKSGR
jgi:hypothetical protein